MRYTAVLAASAMLFGLVACGEKAEPQAIPVTTTQTKGAPAWIDHETVSDGLAAVGIAAANPLKDKQMQRTEAMANGRSNLAAKLKIRVQSAFNQLTQQMKLTTSADRMPVSSEVMQRVQENVSHLLVDQELSGSTPREFWTDPADGTLYVFMVISKENVDSALSTIAKAQIHKEIDQGQTSLKSALDELDAAIAASAS
jgi:hypothetical protein